MKKSLVSLALMVALLMSAFLPMAALANAQQDADWARQRQRMAEASRQQNANWDRQLQTMTWENSHEGYNTHNNGQFGGCYPQSQPRPQYRYERRGKDTLVFLSGVLVGVLLDKVINQSTKCDPQPQQLVVTQQLPQMDCDSQSQPVIVQQAPPQQQVVVNQNTTVVVVDGTATAATLPSQAPRPAGITGAVTLAPWGMGITVPANKPVSVGTQIWFVRSGQIVGKFAVKVISGRTVTLEYISGTKPADGDGFAIVNN